MVLYSMYIAKYEANKFIISQNLLSDNSVHTPDYQ